MRKPTFRTGEGKGADQLHSNYEADQAFVFAAWIVQFLYFLNPKFLASSHLLGSSRFGSEATLLVFLCRGSYKKK